MFNKLISKFKINKYSMIKHGTVAFITMFGVGMFFGVKNIMIAFPIAITSAVMSRQNFQVKKTSKVFRIIALDLLIVFISFLSSQNIYLGVPINFISIFLIIYTVVSPYDLTFYKPFIMLYVFTQYASISLAELPNRFLAVIFGVLVVVVGSFIHMEDEKKILGKNVINTLNNFKKQIENILHGEFDEALLISSSKSMRELVYRIYITRHKKYLTTNLGRFQFKIFIAIEHMNLNLKKIYKDYLKGEIEKEVIEDLLLIVDYIIFYSEGNIESSELLKYSYEISDKYIDPLKYPYNLMDTVLLLVENIKEIELLGKKEINKVYKEWQRSDLDRIKTTFKEYFNPESIRYKFAMRMAITLTMALFIGETLGYYKIIWVIITIMSIMQPYYEDTLSRTKERIVGNVIAIIFTGVTINFINIRWVTVLILIISLYLLYGFKDYSKISLFAAVASICISSLTENINTLIFYRVSYVLVGVLVIILVNRYLFPYKLEYGIEDLKKKIIKLSNMLIGESIKNIARQKETNDIRDIIIHTTLLCHKLYLRNLKEKREEIDKFIDSNTNLVVEVGYKILFEMGGGS
ncbi:FUSC family protein [Clostridium paraputrificum]|uniref:FUSC family protein n=1 Tax=Clostridium TaxID=1485 RepID=UPI003D32D4C9